MDHNLVCNSLGDALLLLSDAVFLAWLAQVHHFGADLGMADWSYPAAVYIVMIVALDLQAKGDGHHCQYRNQCWCSCWWWECQSQQSSWLLYFNVSKCSWEDKHIWELSFYNCCIDSLKFCTSLHCGASVQLVWCWCVSKDTIGGCSLEHVSGVVLVDVCSTALH